MCVHVHVAQICSPRPGTGASLVCGTLKEQQPVKFLPTPLKEKSAAAGRKKLLRSHFIRGKSCTLIGFLSIL